MNIRYPIYEGVYRILTYIRSLRVIHFVLKLAMPGSTGVEEISHVFSFFNCTLHFKGPQHPESTGIIILSHTIVLLSIQAHAP